MLLIVDCDGTVSRIKNPFYAVANELSCYAEIRDYADRYLNGHMPYDELVTRQNLVFREAGRRYANDHGYGKLGPSLFNQVLGGLIGDRCVSPPMVEFLNGVHHSGYHIAMISSGWDVVISRAAQETHIAYWRANGVLFIDGEFAGTIVRVRADKTAEFDSAVCAFATTYPHVSYLGDSAFDLIGMEFIHRRGGDCFVHEDSAREPDVHFPAYVTHFSSFAHMGEHLQSRMDALNRAHGVLLGPGGRRAEP